MENRLIELIYLKISGLISDAELTELKNIASQNPRYNRILRLSDDPAHLSELMSLVNMADSQRSWQQIITKSKQNRKRFLLRGITRYAAVLIILIIGTYVVVQQTYNAVDDPQVRIQPGGTKAILELSSGECIDLASLESGSFADNGTEILASGDNGVSYKSTNAANKTTAYNTLYVPRGGEYKLTLSDGTKVWLNSDTKLKFPVKFDDNTREVWLEGEAYFEVVSNPQKPFHVITSKMNVCATGTAFNVMSYGNEPSAEATLLRGIIAVSNSNRGGGVVVKPGFQAVIGSQATDICIRKIATENVIAWKNGMFFFDNNLEYIMRQLERWYNVTIHFADREVAKEMFYGTISRDEKIENILELLTLTKTIAYEIDDTTITVRKPN